MKKRFVKFSLIVILLLALFAITYTMKSPISVQAQQPTGSIPTVTPLFTGPTGVVNTGLTATVKIRSGPSTLYDEVGVLLPQQAVSIKGKTISGDWLLISYPSGNKGEGWVWAYYLTITGGTDSIPVVEIPPTPTPKYTATIDPTMAAQFVITPQATRLPTYTSAPPVTIPTYSTGVIGNGHIPVGLVILILAGLGGLIGLISFFQAR